MNSGACGGSRRRAPTTSTGARAPSSRTFRRASAWPRWRNGGGIVIDMLDHVERGDEVVVRAPIPSELGKRRVHDRSPEALLGDRRAPLRRARPRRPCRNAEHLEIVPGAAADLEDRGVRRRHRLAADQVGERPRAARDTTSDAGRARPSAGRRPAPSAEHPLSIEQIGRERRDEDRRDQRPPGRSVKSGPVSTQVKTSLRRKPEPWTARNSIFMRRSSLLPWPRKLQRLWRTKPMLTRRGRRSRPRPSAASHRSQDTSRSPNTRRRGRTPPARTGPIDRRFRD